MLAMACPANLAEYGYLVQIANELANQGLCHPLIPSLNATSKDYIKAFLHRLKRSKPALSNKDSAFIFVVIDAADNAQMAANHWG